VANIVIRRYRVAVLIMASKLQRANVAIGSRPRTHGRDSLAHRSTALDSICSSCPQGAATADPGHVRPAMSAGTSAVVDLLSHRWLTGPPVPQIGIAAFCSIDGWGTVDGAIPSPSKFLSYAATMDRRSFLLSSFAVVAGVGSGAPGLMRAAGQNAAERLQRDVLALDHLAPVDPTRAARRGSVLLMDAEVLLPLVPSLSLPIHRAAASAALTAAKCQRWKGDSFGGLLGAAESHATAAHDGPLLGETLLLRARHCGEEAHSLDLSSSLCSKYLTRAIEVAGAGREAAGLRATCRFQLAWEYAVEGSTNVAMTHLSAASAEWGVSGPKAARLRGDVLRLIPGNVVDAERELCSGLVPGCPPVQSAGILIALARLHLADGDVDSAASDLEEAFLANRAAGVRQTWVMAARRGMPDCLAVRELDDVMHEGNA
jgi:hypothetical protein